MESSDKKKVIIIVVVMAVLMIGLSIFMRTGFQSIKKDKLQPTKKEQSSSQTEEKKEEDNTGIKAITVRIDDMTYIMSVDAGEAGQEFAKSTPFDLEMVDLNNNEKYYEGKEKLPTDPYKPGHIDAGDVMLYGDNTIVIFYKSFDTEFSYTRLGKIKNPDSLENMLEGDKVTVEFYKQEVI